MIFIVDGGGHFLLLGSFCGFGGLGSFPFFRKDAFPRAIIFFNDNCTGNTADKLLGVVDKSFRVAIRCLFMLPVISTSRLNSKWTLTNMVARSRHSLANFAF